VIQLFYHLRVDSDLLCDDLLSGSVVGEGQSDINLGRLGDFLGGKLEDRSVIGFEEEWSFSGVEPVDD
jgi:hypothetical protein